MRASTSQRVRGPLVPASPYVLMSLFSAVIVYLLWSQRFLQLPWNARLWLIAAFTGILGSAARTARDLMPRAVSRIPISVPWTQGVLRLVMGAVVASTAWLLTRELFRLTQESSVNGVIAVGVFVGYFAPDVLFRGQVLTDTLLSPPSPTKTSAADRSGQDSTRTAAAGEAERLRKRLARSPGDLAIARELIAALRSAGQIEEAVHVFEQLIDADPQNDALILEEAHFYRDIGDESRYVATRILADESRAKNLFDANVGKIITLAEVECKDLPFFGNFSWQLQPQVNVLLGRNGYGKSHLLRAIVAMLLNDAKVSGQFFPERPKPNTRPTLRVDIDKEGKRESAVRTRQLFEQQFGGVAVLAIPDMRYIEKSEDSFAPLATVPDLRRQGAEQFIQEKPFQGVILTFLYELSNQFARNRSFQSSIFGLIQESVRQLTDQAFTFKDVEELDNAHVRLLVLTEGNAVPLPLQKASQGTLSVVSMVGLTYRFLKALYPNVRDDQIRKQQAIVFIDEIDAHLHPLWQQRILQLFRDTFPNVQFIVTAHTPLVVAGCKRGEVAVLKKESDGFAVKVLDKHFVGASALTLYSEVFGVEDKDLAYLRLNTRQAEKPRLEARRDELLTKKTPSLAEQEELSALDLQIFYLDEVDQISIAREQANNLHRERQRLEMDVKNLKGEIAELKRQMESRQRATDVR
jgi:hypothetical protein